MLSLSSIIFFKGSPFGPQRQLLLEIMKTTLNSQGQDILSTDKCKKTLEATREQGRNDVKQLHPSATEDSLCFIPYDVLLRNLAELQSDTLNLEEQVKSLTEENKSLEEKIDWLRSKTGGSFMPSKAKLGASFSSGDSTLQSALVEVINTMESTALEKARLSFSKSKRARKDKALIAQSEYFDKEYVANQLKQLGLKVKKPLEFFVSYGATLELSPSEKFDTKSYLAMNPDVKNSGINPLLHYIKHGKAEGRVLI